MTITERKKAFYRVRVRGSIQSASTRELASLTSSGLDSVKKYSRSYMREVREELSVRFHAQALEAKCALNN